MSALVVLCEKHATYEKASYNSTNKSVLLEKYLFDKELALQCLVVVQEQKLVGYATYCKQFSTWDAGHYAYLDCLYLEPEVRGYGIGKKLMQKVKSYAIAEKCIGIQWQTPDFNTKAIQFYHRLGATSMRKERFFW